MIEAVMLWNEPNNKSHWDPELDPGWALFAEMAIGQVAHAVTGGANLLIDLKAALHRAHVIRPDRAFEAERMVFRMLRFARGERDAGCANHQDGGGGSECAAVTGDQLGSLG